MSLTYHSSRSSESESASNTFDTAQHKTKGDSSLQFQSNVMIASLQTDKSAIFRHKNNHSSISEGGVTTYYVEECKKEWITERLYAAMVEALFKQKLITETQRRELCVALKCDILNSCDRR